MSLPPESLFGNLHISKTTPTAAASCSGTSNFASFGRCRHQKLAINAFGKTNRRLSTKVMDAPFTFDSNDEMDDFFNFDPFPEPEGDLGGADLNPESALASPFAPSCMQGGDEAA